MGCSLWHWHWHLNATHSNQKNVDLKALRKQTFKSQKIAKNFFIWLKTWWKRRLKFDVTSRPWVRCVATGRGYCGPPPATAPLLPPRTHTHTVVYCKSDERYGCFHDLIFTYHCRGLDIWAVTSCTEGSLCSPYLMLRYVTRVLTPCRRSVCDADTQRRKASKPGRATQLSVAVYLLGVSIRTNFSTYLYKNSESCNCSADRLTINMIELAASND